MVYTEILGNIAEPEWAERYATYSVEHIALDQWAAQKSRLKAVGDRGNEYAIALKRHATLRDGDVVGYDPEKHLLTVVRLRLNDILEIDLGALANMDCETIISTAIELGHAIGNQHWPAVVKDTMVYVPVSIGTDVAASVMDTHAILGTSYAFLAGEDVLSLLDEQEVRRLFGGAERPESGHSHHHCFHDFDHDAFLAREGFANLQGCAEQGTGEGHPLRMREPGPHGRRHRGRRHGHYDER